MFKKYYDPSLITRVCVSDFYKGYSQYYWNESKKSWYREYYNNKKLKNLNEQVTIEEVKKSLCSFEVIKDNEILHKPTVRIFDAQCCKLGGWICETYDEALRMAEKIAKSNQNLSLVLDEKDWVVWNKLGTGVRKMLHDKDRIRILFSNCYNCKSLDNQKAVTEDRFMELLEHVLSSIEDYIEVESADSDLSCDGCKHGLASAEFRNPCELCKRYHVNHKDLYEKQ